MEFLEALKDSALAQLISQSESIWGYPTILFLHTLGLGIVAGANAVISMRVLARGFQSPVSHFDRVFSIMWIGFGLSVLSGLALLIIDPVTKLTQTVFYVKLLFIALAVVNMQIMRDRVFRRGARDDTVVGVGKPLAVTSLALWVAATTAGRLIAYL